MKNIILTSLVLALLSACNQKEATSSQSGPAVAAQSVEMTPENLSDANWKNGIWIGGNGQNAFFMTGNAASAPKVGSHLKFAASGDRTVNAVVVKGPYVNVYLDKPLDPVGDGFPNKVKQ